MAAVPGYVLRGKDADWSACILGCVYTPRAVTGSASTQPPAPPSHGTQTEYAPACHFEERNAACVFYRQCGQRMYHPWGARSDVGEVALQRSVTGIWTVGPVTSTSDRGLVGADGWLRTTTSDGGRLTPEGLKWEAYRGKARGYAASKDISAREVASATRVNTTVGGAAPALEALRGMPAAGADALYSACTEKCLDVLHYGRMQKREVGGGVVWAPRDFALCGVNVGGVRHFELLYFLPNLPPVKPRGMISLGAATRLGETHATASVKQKKKKTRAPRTQGVHRPAFALTLDAEEHRSIVLGSDAQEDVEAWHSAFDRALTELAAARAELDAEIRARNAKSAKVSVLLCTVTFYANLAHSLTRSPLTYLLTCTSSSTEARGGAAPRAERAARAFGARGAERGAARSTRARTRSAPRGVRRRGGGGRRHGGDARRPQVCAMLISFVFPRPRILLFADFFCSSRILFCLLTIRSFARRPQRRARAHRRRERRSGAHRGPWFISFVCVVRFFCLLISFVCSFSFVCSWHTTGPRAEGGRCAAPPRRRVRSPRRAARRDGGEARGGARRRRRGDAVACEGEFFYVPLHFTRILLTI